MSEPSETVRFGRPVASETSEGSIRPRTSDTGPDEYQKLPLEQIKRPWVGEELPIGAAVPRAAGYDPQSVTLSIVASTLLPAVQERISGPIARELHRAAWARQKMSGKHPFSADDQSVGTMAPGMAQWPAVRQCSSRGLSGDAWPGRQGSARKADGAGQRNAIGSSRSSDHLPDTDTSRRMSMNMQGQFADLSTTFPNRELLGRCPEDPRYVSAAPGGNSAKEFHRLHEVARQAEDSRRGRARTLPGD